MEEPEDENHILANSMMIDIPKDFFSDETGEPFRECLMCKTDLSDGVPYMVEKAMRRYPAIGTEEMQLELAVCLDCSEKMRNQLSKESLANIQLFFQNHMEENGPPNREFDFFERKAINWKNNCMLKRDPIEDMTEYHMYGLFVGNQMAFSMFPYIISGAALNEMQELLSAQTKDEMDDFLDTHFGLPPELRDLFKDNPVLVM